jgi:tellurite resistance protein TehA-like permease
MYGNVSEFKRYTPGEVLFVIGLSIVILVIGCTFVGYGVYVTELMNSPIDLFRPIISKFFPVELISNFLGGNYLQAVYIGWIIGVICIVAGLLGFASAIRWATFKLLKRRH